MSGSGAEAISWSGSEADPLVALVHGAMDRAAGLARLARQLDHRARVVRYDRRGYGKAAGHPGPFTISAHVDDLIDILAGRPALLVGHSLGGDIVLAAAARRPDLALGVVVFEPPLPWMHWWPRTSASSEAIRGEVSTPAQDAETAERFMRRLIGNARWEALPERTRQIRRREGPALVAELRDLATTPWHPHEIRCPVTVGVSEHARPHHRRATAELASGIPGAVLVELPECHHDAHITAPGAFAERLVVPQLEALRNR